jgi:hypothetical protein
MISDLETNLLYSCSLQRIQELLRVLVNEKRHRTNEDNLALLRLLGQKQNFTFLLNQIRCDSILMKSVADRSYTHFNYFDKIVLIDSPENGYRLTLHIWWPPFTEGELNEDRIHNHRFDFWSVIITGKLKSQFYCEASNGKKYYKSVYIPIEKQPRSSMQYIGETELVKTNYSELNPGDSYFLTYTSIHKVVLPKDQVTSTLVLRGPRVRSRADVFNSFMPCTKSWINPPRIRATELEQKLASLCRILDDGR